MRDCFSEENERRLEKFLEILWRVDLNTIFIIINLNLMIKLISYNKESNGGG